MTNDLVGPTDLSGFPGAPFTDAVVDSAVAELRKVARWHIAPEVSETVVVESGGGQTIVLPTLHLSAVTAVRDASATDATPTVVDGGWRSNSTLRFRAGVVTRPSDWPCGELEVDITHGYEACPPDLLPVIAAACRQIGADSRTVQSQSAGPFAVTFREPSGELDPTVARYALPSRP